MFDPRLEKYAKHLVKQREEYSKYQYEGKNGANSDNEKGFWRGMVTSIEGILNDLYKAGLIRHRGIFGDPWPEEEQNVKQE